MGSFLRASPQGHRNNSARRVKVASAQACQSGKALSRLSAGTKTLFLQHRTSSLAWLHQRPEEIHTSRIGRHYSSKVTT